VRIAVKTSRNTLIVGVQGLTAAVANTLKQRYGFELIVIDDDIATADSHCPAANDCRPIKGGIAINASGGLPSDCTAGFVVRLSSTNGLAILTAGHCIQVYGGYDVLWMHNNDSFGRARHETWVPGGSGPSDVGISTIFTTESIPNKNHMRRINNNIVNVLGIQGAPGEGGQACRVGVAGGHDCGIVTDYPAMRVSSAPGWAAMTVNQTATVNFDSLSGDSGGPVFYYIGGGTTGNVVVEGTHVHSETGAGADESWFSPFFVGRSDYQNRHGYSYLACTDADC
jgi:hypothetical protein